MADYGRVSSSIAEAVVEVPSADAKGRVTSSFAEAVVLTDDALGRVSSSFAEAVVLTDDALGRVSSSFAEAVVQDVGPEVRVSTLMVEVFAKAPVGATPRKLNPLGGGIQGRRASTPRRRR